jgi:hypothetical protein
MRKVLALAAVALSVFCAATWTSKAEGAAPPPGHTQAACVPEPVWGCQWLGTQYVYCHWTIIGYGWPPNCAPGSP